MNGILYGSTFLRSLGSAAALFLLAQAAPMPRAHAQTSRVLAVGLTNIAAAASGGTVVSATSTLDNDETFKAGNLIDGQVYNPKTNTGSAGWASNKFDPVNMDYVTFAFAGKSIKTIGKLVFNPFTALNPERWAKDIEVQVSTDTEDGPYTPIAQITLKREGGRQEFPVLPTKARYVRLMFRSNWGSDRAVSLGEVEMYEAIDTKDPMGAVIARLEGTITDLQRYKETQADILSSIGTRTSAEVAPKPTLSKVALTPADLRTVQAAKPAKAVPPATSNNIAAAKNGGRIVDSTSTFNNDPNYGPEQLIDGKNFSGDEENGSFGWASEGFTPGQQYVTIGFRDDRTHVINKIVLNPLSNQSSMRWASRVDVMVTSDAPKEGPFRTIATFNIRQEAANQEFSLRPVEAKYVRFVFTANGPGNPLPKGDPNVSSDRSVSLGEIEIYEPPADSGTLDALISRFKQVLTDLKNLREAPGATAPAVAALAPPPAPATVAANPPAAADTQNVAPTTPEQPQKRDAPLNASTKKPAKPGAKVAQSPSAKPKTIASTAKKPSTAAPEQSRLVDAVR